MSEDIRKFAQQHVAALAEPINDLVGRVIAKGLTGILEECCVLQRRVTELEAQLAERDTRDAQQEKNEATGTMLSNSIDLINDLERKLHHAEKDAARWRMLTAFTEEHQIDYVRLINQIDAALSAQANKGEKANG